MANYNKFRWYTSRLRKKPLPSNFPLLLRIKNGDFEYSSYFDEAKYNRELAVEAYEMTKKHAMISDPAQLELEALYSGRMKRIKALKLDEAGDKDELSRLRSLKNALTEEFEKDLWEKSMDRQRGKGTTEDLYWWYKKQCKLAYTKSELQIDIMIKKGKL
jgi:hypothetical protein|tara:strand:- start:994 stop:1473 length:480 start_codon:yes stop_codon:yes gene_type:complete